MLHEPEWISDDAISLRVFLQSPTGRKMLDTLTVRRPGFFPDEASQESSFSRSRVIAGYERALSELLSMSAPVDDAPAPQPEAFPDLDDDSKWPQPK